MFEFVVHPKKVWVEGILIHSQWTSCDVHEDEFNDDFSFKCLKLELTCSYDLSCAKM